MTQRQGQAQNSGGLNPHPTALPLCTLIIYRTFRGQAVILLTPEVNENFIGQILLRYCSFLR